ncbi:unnamed protein product [Linum tenue]|uniref:TIR domain-containing protein n=1 Tax=Linum tenue TaxID=586396 RepID=A0AAV0JVW8_9ROSI|nr:unnamed protein product [Linum tenue]
MFSSGMTSNIRGAATFAALVLPLILFYKLLWSRRRSTFNDETSDNNCDSTSQQPDSQLPLPAAQYFDPTDSSDLLPFPSVEYEVFLSFRGSDTRHQITDILFRFLVHLKIHTFKDDDELRKGEGIWPSLVKAIGQSKIYVPILSKSYAHSRWCLKELVEIVENMRQDKRRIVLPIFYMVDPRDVRHQTGPYRDAFREHEKNFDRQTIQNWKAALTTVGALKGWHVTHNDEQSKYADLVSDSIWSHLRRFYSTVETNELVAIDGHVEEVVKRLSLDFKDVTMVGLHGMGGIGKTTLAKVVYNKILSHFDRCSFVENIRETQHQNDGIFKIQKKIIEDATRKEERVCDVSQGRRIIMDRVSQFKVLIVLDDVDEEFKFGEVVGNPRGFVSGSRFIVTSRDCKMQDGCRFQMHDQLRDMGREIVRRENIEYPWMRSRIWTVETAVELLHEKKGSEQVKAIEVTTPRPYTNLASECFVNLSSLRYFKAPPDAKLKGDFDNLLPNLRWLKMRYHRGRLGDDDHLINFHMKKLVILDLSGSDVCNDWGGWTHLKMANNLKTLNLSKCGRLTRLPELPQSGSLEVLDLSSYRWLKSTRDDELDIGKLRNLMVLRLPRACIKKITGGTIGTISKGLRELDVEECECENLAHVLADVGELQSLQILRTRSANWKQALSLTTGSVATTPSSLQRLVITGCTSLLQERRWPVQIPNLSNFPRLRILHLKDMRIDGKQSVALEGLECLEELEALILGNLQPPVERLPSLSHMTKLMSIEIMDMPSLREIEGFGSLMSLFIVKLRNCSSLERLELSGLRKLRSLQIMDMPSLREIEGFASLKSLATLQLTDCTSLKMLDLSGLENLEVLDISRCPKLETVALSSLSNPGKLRSLEIMEMPSLREVEGLANLKSLQTLNLRGCTSLGNVTSLGTTLAVGNDKC